MSRNNSFALVRVSVYSEHLNMLIFSKNLINFKHFVTYLEKNQHFISVIYKEYILWHLLSMMSISDFFVLDRCVFLFLLFRVYYFLNEFCVFYQFWKTLLFSLYIASPTCLAVIYSALS